MTLDKATLRKAMIAARAAIGPDARAHASGAVAAQAGALLALAPGGNVAPVVSSYWAIGPELDAVALEAAAVARGASLALPVMVAKGKALVFRSYRHGAELMERKWDIREPLPTAPEVLPDIVLVPALAFDRRGNRLGYGAGFYDRSLAELRAAKAVVAVGLAYDEQVIDAVPHMEHDTPVDWLLTPSGLLDCRAGT